MSAQDAPEQERPSPNRLPPVRSLVTVAAVSHSTVPETITLEYWNGDVRSPPVHITAVRQPPIGALVRVAAVNLWTDPATITLDFWTGDLRTAPVQITVAVTAIETLASRRT